MVQVIKHTHRKVQVMKTQTYRIGLWAAPALAVMLGVATVAHAKDITVDLDVPAHVNVTVKADGCNNSGGPQISLSGAIRLGNVTGDVIFKNNVKGTKKVVVTDVITGVVVDFGDGFEIPKQPSRQADSLGADCTGTGVGGNPYIWIYLVDNDGNPMSEPFLLGRCVQGFQANADFSFLTSSHAKGHVEGSGCLNNPGPYISLTGDLTLRGLKGKVVMMNNPNPPDPHTAVCAATFDIIFEGTAFTICKSPSDKQQACEYGPGAGGNPIICVILRSSTDSSGEICLGRCNKL
jgi:polyisoprenoid-binding protein YceI